MSSKKLKLFISYSHKDEGLLRDLEAHLAALYREGKVEKWCDRQIIPGSNWERNIEEKLKNADIILLLVSPEFIASEYCYSKETAQAIKQHESRKSIIIPIIIRPVDWEGVPFREIQGLPKDGLAVTSWNNVDEAWMNVVQGIRVSINNIKDETDNEEILKLRAEIENYHVQISGLEDNIDILKSTHANNKVSSSYIGEYMKSVSRQEARTLNQYAIEDAKEEIRSFAGDLSWARDSIDVLRKRRDAGVRIRILAKEPVSTQSKDIIYKLISEKGIQLKYFSKDTDPMIRGIMIDPLSLNYSQLFSKRIIVEENGAIVSTFDRQMLKISGSNESRIQSALNVLFELGWEKGQECSVFVEDSETIKFRLAKIPQYSNAKIELKRIKLRELLPMHRYLHRKRLTSIEKLEKRFILHDSEVFKPLKLTYKNRTHFVCSLIVEMHDNLKYIIDGVHRAYYLKEKGEEWVWCYLVERVKTPPPGELWSWDDIQIKNHNNPNREDNFKNYKDEYWRDLSNVMGEKML